MTASRQEGGVCTVSEPGDLAEQLPRCRWPPLVVVEVVGRANRAHRGTSEDQSREAHLAARPLHSPRRPPPAGIGRSSSASDATGSLPDPARSGSSRHSSPERKRSRGSLPCNPKPPRPRRRQFACSAELSPQPSWPSRWVTCDLPGVQGAREAPAARHGAGSRAIPSNLPQGLVWRGRVGRVRSRRRGRRGGSRG